MDIWSFLNGAAMVAAAAYAVSVPVTMVWSVLERRRAATERRSHSRPWTEA